VILDASNVVENAFLRTGMRKEFAFLERAGLRTGKEGGHLADFIAVCFSARRQDECGQVRTQDVWSEKRLAFRGHWGDPTTMKNSL